jgi:hypothetical protein
MSLARLVSHSILTIRTSIKPLSIPPRRKFATDRQHENAPSWREIQKDKPAGPHLKHTTSTISNDMPSVGVDKPPPELLMSADPDFVLKDSVPKNTKPKTESVQSDEAIDGLNTELGVGEMEGAKFKIEPLRRTGEDANTLRARLLCPFLLLATYACRSTS